METTSMDRGKRLDQFLRERLPEYSRARLQDWIEQGRVLVNGTPEKRSFLLKGSEHIDVDPAELAPLRATPEDLPLDVLYEDADVIAINKPAGMVVHTGAGQHSGTLVNAVLHRFGKLSTVGGDLRPGIVHRLDRFTSGVILVARNDAAHRHLAAQFASREVEKIYLALVHGRTKKDEGRIITPIARDPVHRTRMTARLARGRQAITSYQVLKRFEGFTYLEVKIGTGRTHQIRVHLASIGHPVAGDKLYGAPASTLGRYFLHARQITFTSPSTSERITVAAPLPPDLEGVLLGLGAGRA
ncbi:MAG TPA: RluA family pseudouridine synthase [Bryobacteraceae bacterium]|nr:RluA family pseudouridine synthase [Bryobacteraceae bacterium]